MILFNLLELTFVLCRCICSISSKASLCTDAVVVRIVVVVLFEAVVSVKVFFVIFILLIRIVVFFELCKAVLADVVASGTRSVENVAAVKLETCPIK